MKLVELPLVNGGFVNIALEYVVDLQERGDNASVTMITGSSHFVALDIVTLRGELLNALYSVQMPPNVFDEPEPDTSDIPEQTEADFKKMKVKKPKPKPKKVAEKAEPQPDVPEMPPGLLDDIPSDAKSEPEPDPLRGTSV